MLAQPEHLPTPEQIAEACKAIQATWTPEERRKRAMHISGEVVTRKFPPLLLGIRTAKISDLYGTLMQTESDNDILLSHLPYSER